jgi:hypothetical protein
MGNKNTSIVFFRILRTSLKNRFPHSKITSIFFANEYNKHFLGHDSISSETARIWLNGNVLPSYARLVNIINWLSIPFDELGIANNNTFNNQIHPISNHALLNTLFSQLEIMPRDQLLDVVFYCVTVLKSDKSNSSN